MIRLLIAEDHQLVRKAYISLFALEPTLQVVAETSKGQEVLPLINQEKAELVLLDLCLPDVYGCEVIREVTSQTNVPVIVVSAYTTDWIVLEAIQSGAQGYVAKESAPTELITSIQTVVTGNPYLCRVVSSPDLLKLMTLHQKPTDILSFITPREKRVLQLAAEGLSSHEIGSILGVSSRTVESHRASFMRKLRLKNQTDIVMFALRKKLLTIQPSIDIPAIPRGMDRSGNS